MPNGWFKPGQVCINILQINNDKHGGRKKSEMTRPYRKSVITTKLIHALIENHRYYKIMKSNTRK